MSEFAIETRGLVKRFGTTRVLHGIDLQVPRGSVFGLVGPNGAGKTTTFSLLCGFLRPTQGEIRILGHAPDDRVNLAGRVGALPQDAPLPARMRVLDALRYFAELGGMSPAHALAAAGAALGSVGLERDGTKRCGELSHGMAKRVSLAQAFLGNPELVLLDEPTSGLDPKSAREVKDLIRERGRRATVVLSSHNLEQIEELCDGVAIIDQGRLARQGTLSDVTGQGELVRIALADERADAVLEAVGPLGCVSQVVFQPATRTLEVRISGAAPEEAIPEVLRAALGAGGRVVGVSRGRRLEERVLELT